MILTGKAKNDFLAYYGTGENYFKDTINDIEHHANIVEWFDSVGIYIDIDVSTATNIVMFSYFISHKDYFRSTEDSWKSRSEATKAAIIKANEIYNEQTKTTTST